MLPHSISLSFFSHYPSRCTYLHHRQTLIRGFVLSLSLSLSLSICFPLHLSLSPPHTHTFPPIILSFFLYLSLSLTHTHTLSHSVAMALFVAACFAGQIQNFTLEKCFKFRLIVESGKTQTPAKTKDGSAKFRHFG